MKIFCLLIPVTLCMSCHQDLPADKQTPETTKIAPPVKKAAASVAAPETVDSETWIDDFKDFRSAIQQNDLTKMAAYFSFPFEDKGFVIWNLCQLSEEDMAIRKKNMTHPELFYEKDLKQYHQYIFDKYFAALLLKVKTDELYRTNHTESTEIIAKDGIYKLYADYSAEENSLTLNMSVGNNTKDENGEYMSEGEFNIIYQFKILANKKMLLSRIDMAG